MHCSYCHTRQQLGMDWWSDWSYMMYQSHDSAECQVMLTEEELAENKAWRERDQACEAVFGFIFRLLDTNEIPF